MSPGRQTAPQRSHGFAGANHDFIELRLRQRGEGVSWVMEPHRSPTLVSSESLSLGSPAVKPWLSS